MRSSSKTLFIIVTAYLATTASALTCTREGLLAAANTYLAAQVSGNPKLLKLASSNFTYMQNNKASEISTGLLSAPFTIDLNRSTADTTACASYTMWISASASKPFVVGTQIRHAANDTSVISSIDTIASTTGDLFFNATKTLSYIRNQNWGLLPTSSQPSRASLKAIGDAYLDMWTNATALNAIPWGTDCVRVEGSSYVEHCGANLPRGGSKTENGLRRYVIDEGTGSVQINCQFDSLGPWPDSHEIRVEAGKVKYVHTVTVLRGVGA